jgi:hypothetical protein
VGTSDESLYTKFYQLSYGDVIFTNNKFENFKDIAVESIAFIEVVKGSQCFLEGRQ